MQKISKNVIPNFYEQIDTMTKEHDKPCKLGCSHCCHQFILSVSVEVPYILRRLKQLPADKLSIIEKNIADFVEYYNNNTPNGRTLDRIEGIYDFNKKMAKDMYPCPFLIDNSCSIYDFRPIVCRVHFVKNKPELCKEHPLRDECAASVEIGNSAIFSLMQQVDFTWDPLFFKVAKMFNKKAKLKPIEKDEGDREFIEKFRNSTTVRH